MENECFPHRTLKVSLANNARFSVTGISACVNIVACFLITTTRGHLADKNVVLTWNDFTLNAIAWQGISPPEATRLLAILHGAIVTTLDTNAEVNANCIDQIPLAVSAAAHYVVVGVYPTTRSRADKLHRQIWSGANCRESLKAHANEAGESVARLALAERIGDGFARFQQFVAPETTETSWKPTPPEYNPNPILPFWGELTPFGHIASLDDVIPGKPPSVLTMEYSANWYKTWALGGRNSTLRSKFQTEVALLWAFGGGTITPPGAWNQIAHQVLQHNKLSSNIRACARTFWLLNVCLANVAIACWKTKYRYNEWRPVTAFRKGIADSSLPVDPNWEPLLPTPNFPEYTSGHSGFSAAGARILSNLFGDEQYFTVSDGVLTHDFNSLIIAASQAGQSRIYGGIHFDFSDKASQELGRRIADRVCLHHGCGFLL